MNHAHLRPLAALAALALLAGGCGGKGDEKVGTGASSSSSSTSSTVAPAADESGGGATAGPVGAGGTGSATGQTDDITPTTQGAAGDGGGGAASPAQPSAAGTYEYATEGTVTSSGAMGGTRAFPTTTKLTVEPPQDVRQRTVRDMRDSSGDGEITTTILQYRADGVYLESLKLQTRVGGITVTYEFRPDPAQLLAPTGTAVGYHTEFAMTSTDGGLKTTTTVDALGEETVTIGGTAVPTYKVRIHTAVEGDADGETTSDANIDPQRYLIVREHTVGDIKSAFGTSHSDQTSTLKSLDPK